MELEKDIGENIKNNSAIKEKCDFLEEDFFENLSNKQLIEKYQSGNKKILDILLKKNIDLICKCQLDLKINCSLDKDDLIQEGFFGFKKSIEQFDLANDKNFYDYSIRFIKEAMIKAIEETDCIIRVPDDIKNRVKKILKIIKNENEININFLSKKINVSKKGTKEGLDVIRNLDLISFFSFIAKDGEIIRNKSIDLFLSTKKNAEEILIENETKNVVTNSLNVLSPRELMIIKKRFSLTEKGECTLQEIAKEEGVTRERIRQIEERALKKLKNYIITRRLKKYIFNKKQEIRNKIA